jgi:hypothetical protein
MSERTVTVPVEFRDHRSPAVSAVLYGKSVFVITFRKVVLRA